MPGDCRSAALGSYAARGDRFPRTRARPVQRQGLRHAELQVEVSMVDPRIETAPCAIVFTSTDANPIHRFDLQKASPSMAPMDWGPPCA